jgi:ADP-ribosyl-[dinitrogen reductase] hydrolase
MAPGTRLQTDGQRGCSFGLAIADALGAAVEFEIPGTFQPVTGYRGGGPHGLADSIAEVGWDLNDQAERYLRWWQTGAYSVNGRCFDIGNTTIAALHRFQETGDARTSGDRAEYASGKGSIMRLAPVPIRYGYMFPDGIGDLVERAVESSLPTHASPQCLSACVYLTLVLCGLIDGRPREEVLGPEWEPMRRARDIASFHPEIAEVAEGSFLRKRPPEIVGSGYVVKSLEAALGAFRDAQDFREAVLRAVNLGDDADTTGAVCGQLAGACWGESGIPREWLGGLARRDMIDRAFARLLGKEG